MQAARVCYSQPLSCLLHPLRVPHRILDVRWKMCHLQHELLEERDQRAEEGPRAAQVEGFEAEPHVETTDTILGQNLASHLEKLGNARGAEPFREGKREGGGGGGGRERVRVSAVVLERAHRVMQLTDGEGVFLGRRGQDSLLRRRADDIARRVEHGTEHSRQKPASKVLELPNRVSVEDLHAKGPANRRSPRRKRSMCTEQNRIWCSVSFSSAPCVGQHLLLLGGIGRVEYRP